MAMCSGAEIMRPFQFIHQCKSRTVRVMNLMLHLSMLRIVSASKYKNALGRQRALLRLDDDFVWTQIRSDLKVLCALRSTATEDVCLAMHLLFFELLICKSCLVEGPSTTEECRTRHMFEQALATEIDVALDQESADEATQKFP